MSLSKYDQMIVFGDSLSDTGNYFNHISNHTFPDPDLSYGGRFSNGPVWIEYLAKKQGASLVNYAYASSTSDGEIFPANDPRIPGCLQQIESFLDSNPVVTNSTLFVIASMGNDFYNPRATMSMVIQNIERGTRRIIQETGAKNFLYLINGAPDIYPTFKHMSDSLRSQFMNALKDTMPSWTGFFKSIRPQFPQVDFRFLNYRETLLELKSQLRTDMGCVSDTGLLTKSDSHAACDDPSRFLFWDGIHPTTKAHQLIAERAEQAVL